MLLMVCFLWHVLAGRDIVLKKRSGKFELTIFLIAHYTTAFGCGCFMASKKEKGVEVDGVLRKSLCIQKQGES